MAEKKDDKTIMLAAAALLCILIISGGYYWFVLAGQAPQNQDDAQSQFDKKVAASKSAQVMFAALDKQKNFTGIYDIEYNQTYATGLQEWIGVASSEEYKYIRQKNILYTQTAYHLDNETIFCQTDLEKKPHCAKVESGYSYNISLALKDLLITYDADAKPQNERLFRMDIIKFIGEPKKKMVAGRSCIQIEYALDFSNVSEFQLPSLGMTADDPMLTVFRNFTMQRCFDDEYGRTIYSQLQYGTVFDDTIQTHVVEYEKLKFDTPDKEIPATDYDQKQIENLVIQMGGFAQKVDECQEEETNLTTCILLTAIASEDIRACSLIDEKEQRDQCALRIALYEGKAQACEKTGELRDECYLNYAHINKDTSYCTQIQNNEYREQCQMVVLPTQDVVEEVN